MPIKTRFKLYAAVALALHGTANAAVLRSDDDQAWIRVVESETQFALEAVSRIYAPTEGDGPVIHLVSAIHIGDWEFYDRVQSLLDEVPVVLWEGVGGGFETVDDPAVRDNEEASRVRTLRKVRFLDTVARLSGMAPGSVDEIEANVAESLRPLVEQARTDAWGNEVVINSAGDSWSVVSLGADGKPGGEGLDADVRSDEHVSPPESMGVEGLQADLALALGLMFQMDGVDYQRAHWRNSDLSVSELRRAFRGENVAAREAPAGSPEQGAIGRRKAPEAGEGDSDQTDALLKTLSGEGAIAGAMKFVVGFMGKTPQSRAIAKIMLSEVLSRAEEMMAMQQGPMADMLDVIIHARNDRVLYDIDQIRENEPDIEQLAIFYGGGHLESMANALVERGYEPAGEIWFPAITVDLTAESLDLERVEQSRRMIKMFLEMSIPKLPAPKPAPDTGAASEEAAE